MVLLRYWGRVTLLLVVVWCSLIAATQIHKGEPFPLLYFRGDEQQIIRVKLGTSKTIQVTSINATNLYYISPDGRYWLQHQNEPLTLTLWSVDSNKPYLRYQDERAANFVLARWSPDSQTVAVVARSNINGFLYHISLDRTVKHLDLPNPQQMLIQNIAWSPDSQHLAYTYSQGLRVHDIAQDEGILISNTNNTSRYDSPTWSPDGKRILFLEQGGNYRICLKTLNPDGTDIKTLSCGYSNIGPGIVNPNWSSNSQEITFALAPNPQISPSIYVIDADGRNLHRLTNTANIQGSPHWTPDMRAIVYTQYSLGDFKSSVALLDPQSRIHITILQDQGAGAMWYPMGADYRNRRITDNTFP